MQIVGNFGVRPRFSYLLLSCCQKFSFGFNSGEQGGRNNIVILSGILSCFDLCQPALSITITA